MEVTSRFTVVLENGKKLHFYLCFWVVSEWPQRLKSPFYKFTAFFTFFFRENRFYKFVHFFGGFLSTVCSYITILLVILQRDNGLIELFK